MEPRCARTEDYPQGFLSLLPQLEEKIEYRFQEKKYLYIALTHSSFSNEKRSRILYEHNERQEFLWYLSTCFSITRPFPKEY